MENINWLLKICDKNHNYQSCYTDDTYKKIKLKKLNKKRLSKLNK